MPRIFDKSKLRTDCANCDAVCCAAFRLPYADYPKPPRVPCKHLDLTRRRCTIFAELEARGYDICRSFDCHGAGVAVAALFRELGRSWNTDADIAAVQFHTFSIVYFTLVKYLNPDRAIELDVPANVIEDLKPFTEAALDFLADSADPFSVIER